MGFVDDVKAGLTSPTKYRGRPNEVDLMNADLIHSMQTWCYLQHIIGGELEVNKTFASPLMYGTVNGRAELMSVEEAGFGNLTIRDPKTGKQAKASAINPWTEDPTNPAKRFPKYLGVHKPMDGSQADERERLKDISRKYAGTMRGKSVQPYKATTIHSQYFMAQVKYSLPSTYLTEDECEEIRKISGQMFISRMGFNRKMPTSVMYGPVEMEGAGMSDIYTEQGVGSIQQFIGNIRTGSDLGEMMKIVLSNLQLWAGTVKPILENTAVALPYLPDSWITGIRNFLAKIDGTIEISDTWVPAFPRIGDRCIMDDILKLGFSESQLEKINLCRLYARVYFASDLCDINSRIIQSDLLFGKRKQRTRWLWPDLPLPRESDFALFRKAIIMCYSPKNAKRKLRPTSRVSVNTQFGPWIRGNYHRIDKWIYNERTDTLYEMLSNKYLRVYSREEGEREFIETDEQVRNVPDDCIPATVHKAKNARLTRYVQSVEPWVAGVVKEYDGMNLRQRIDAQP